MIALTKGAEPSVLATNKVAWTAEFITGGPDRRRYGQSRIRDPLRSETHQKCAYCETRAETVTTLQVEHILPKSTHPKLVCDWNNLTLACPACNVQKGDYDDAVCPLVNPYVDNPADHLRWKGPLVTFVTPDRGRITMTRLKLNRAELLFRRGTEYLRIWDILQRMKTCSPAVKSALEEDLRSGIQVEAEYSASIRALIEEELGVAFK